MNKEQFLVDFRDEFIDGDTIKLDETTEFRNIGSWDSLTGMALLVMIQDKYDPGFDEDKFKACTTVADVYNVLAK